MKEKSVSFTVRDMKFPVRGKVEEYGHGLLILSMATSQEKYTDRPEKTVDLGNIAIPIANIVGIIKIHKIRLGTPLEPAKSEG